MFSFVSLLKSALVAIVLAALVLETESAAEKLAPCCKVVNREEISEPITGYLLQKANPPCVPAVIFQTATGLYCSHVKAPWVRRRIAAFEKAKARATPSSATPSSTFSLLSAITPTGPPPSSPPPPSSQAPAGESLSEGHDE